MRGPAPEEPVAGADLPALGAACASAVFPP
jgi:hypothetical protein